MIAFPRRRAFFSLVALVGAPVFALPGAGAAVRTWDGGGTDGFWTTAANWTNDVAPVAGDDLVFPAGAARLINTNNFSLGTLFNSITLSGGNYTLNGSTILLNAGVDASSATGPNAVHVPLTLNSNQSITTFSAVVDFYGAIDTNGKDLTFAGLGAADVFSSISGTGGLIKTNSGAASVNLSNSFSGPVQVLQGIFGVHHSNGLGSISGNTTVAAGATLSLAYGIMSPEPIVLAGTLFSSFQTNTLTGPINLTASNATIQADTRSPLTISGVISGSGGFTKTGSGMLTLSAANTYVGATTVSAGTLRVNGSQPASPIELTGGTLDGTGTVGHVSSSGATAKTIAPGTGGPGILTCSNLALNGSTTLAIDLNGTTAGSGYDQLKVRGTVALSNALLNVSLGFTPALGQSFLILDNDGAEPVNGTFAGLPEGTTFALGTNQFWITYAGGTGNDVVLVRTNLSVTGVTRVWTGAGTNNFWTNPNNWTNNLAAGPGDNLLFPAGAARLSNTNNFPAGTIFNSITFSGGNYSLGGTNIVLNAGLNATNTGSANSIFFPITLNSNQTFISSNTGINLNLFVTIDTNGKDLTFAGNGGVQISGAISGAGGLIRTGNGATSLYASNTFSGPVQVLQGNLRVYHSNALSTTNANTTISAGAMLSFGNIIDVAEPIVLAGAMDNASGLQVNLTGPIMLMGSNVTIFAPLTIRGIISGSAGFTKMGSGTLTLNANNTYTGITTIREGQLEVNGSQPASPIVLDSINTVATLSGTGRVGIITATGPLLNRIDPGLFSSAILSSSNITLNASTFFVVDLNGTTPGTGFDQLNVGGTVNLASAILAVSLGFTPGAGDSFKIINNDGADAIIGTFNNLPEGQVFTNSSVLFRISYVGGDGNDVVLTRLNPPAQFTSIAKLTNNSIQLQAAGVSNLTYTIQASTNLSIWTNIGTAPADGAGVFSFTDTNALLLPMRFYRALSP